MDNIKLTIFTPTYNRAHTISRVYKSILHQDPNLLDEIEWLIVDDGSSDNTESIVREWMDASLPFTLRYIKQTNGGKHIAFNRAVQEAHGDYFFTVDSDDWLADDSIKNIFCLSAQICNDKELAGVIALKCFPSGNIIGTSYPKENYVSSLHDLSVLGYGGERSLVFKTKDLKQFPFPVIKGERFCTESVVYDQIDLKYRFYVSNCILTVCEYQEDGLTSNIFALMVRNAVGYKIYYAQRIDMASSLKERIAYAIRYNAFDWLKRETEHNYNGEHKCLVRLMLPFGILAYIYYRLKK